MPRQSALAAALAAAALLAAAPGCGHNNSGPQSTEQQSRGTTRRSAPPQSYADVVDHVAPSVVTILAEQRAHPPRQFPFFFGNPFGGQQGPPSGRGGVQMALGSGVIVDSNGHCVTNFHVVDGAEKIRVTFPNGRGYEAKVVGTDTPSDLALLKIDAKGLPACRSATPTRCGWATWCWRSATRSASARP